MDFVRILHGDRLRLCSAVTCGASIGRFGAMII